MASEIRLGFKLDLCITAPDVREPIFAYYHRIERSRENQEAQRHGQGLVTKTFRDSGRYWVTLSFPDLPDIFCLDELTTTCGEFHWKRRSTELEHKAKILLGSHGGTRTLSPPRGKAYGCLTSRSLITGSKRSSARNSPKILTGNLFTLRRKLSKRSQRR